MNRKLGPKKPRQRFYRPKSQLVCARCSGYFWRTDMREESTEANNRAAGALVCKTCYDGPYIASGKDIDLDQPDPLKVDPRNNDQKGFTRVERY